MPNPTTLEIIEATQRILALPKNWCQGTIAETVTHAPTSVVSKDACRFCSGGSIFRATFDLLGLDANDTEAYSRNFDIANYASIEARELIAKAVKENPDAPVGKIVAYNDAPERTYNQIVSVLDRARVLAQGGQA